MSYRVRYTSEAEQDLLKLAEFEFKATGETRGADHLQLMLNNLADNPNIGTQYDEYLVIRHMNMKATLSGLHCC